MRCIDSARESEQKKKEAELFRCELMPRPYGIRDRSIAAHADGIVEFIDVARVR